MYKAKLLALLPNLGSECLRAALLTLSRCATPAATSPGASCQPPPGCVGFSSVSLGSALAHRKPLAWRMLSTLASVAVRLPHSVSAAALRLHRPLLTAPLTPACLPSMSVYFCILGVCVFIVLFTLAYNCFTCFVCKSRSFKEAEITRIWYILVSLSPNLVPGKYTINI